MSVIVGDSGNDPIKVASGQTSGSIVLVPDGLKKKKKKSAKIKEFKEFVADTREIDELVEKFTSGWMPLSDKTKAKLFGIKNSKHIKRIYTKLLSQFKSGKWDDRYNTPLDVLADMFDSRPNIMIPFLQKLGFNDSDINMSPDSVPIN